MNSVLHMKVCLIIGRTYNDMYGCYRS